jgi:hypothetical protein
MRPWTFPIVGAVAFSLTVPATGDARPRFGPGAILGAVAAPLGAVLGGARPAFAQRVRHRGETRGETDSSDGRRTDGAARSEQPPAASTAPERAGPVFWPRASDDLLDYAFFPKGKDEGFWAIGYSSILAGAFASSNADDARARRSLAVSNRDLSNKDLANKDFANKDLANKNLANNDDAASAAKGLLAAADLCGSGQTAASADQVIERIEQAIRPSAAQRDILERLRTALAQAIERINTVCPAAAPATPTERLKAIQDRIWAMRDALLTVRLPFEQLYGSLTGDQDWRLAREAESREVTGTIGTADRRSEMCSEQAADIAGWPMRAIERALRPTEQQRAGLEALRMRLAGMAQLIISSCPTYPLLGPMGRIAAASDRLDVMLFAVMTMTPALPDFYESLSDKQKVSLDRVIRQLRRPAGSGDRS